MRLKIMQTVRRVLKQKISRRTLFIGGLFGFLLFWSIATIGLDPDFGWHLRLSELIWKTGLRQYTKY